MFRFEQKIHKLMKKKNTMKTSGGQKVNGWCFMVRSESEAYEVR